MKKLSLFIFLLSSAACSNLEDSIPVEEIEIKEPASYIEFEGRIDMGTGEELVYGALDQPKMRHDIRVDWSFGEFVWFASKKFDFAETEGRIWGNGACMMMEVLSKEVMWMKGESWLYFEPADEFWDCLEYDYCDVGDEVFNFRLMVREVQ